MLIDTISPVIFTIGPFTVRWYGVMVAVSFLIGTYFILKNGKERGYTEDQLLNSLIIAVICGLIGSRFIYVITNLPYYLDNPAQIIRIDQGGLSFHGALIGGIGSFALIHRKVGIALREGIDLSVPGFTFGIMLVRIANIFNQEILGRPTEFFPFPRHPAQIYGSLIGLILFILYLRLKNRKPYYPGELFWSFALNYSIMRGLIEETFREVPLIAWGYINTYYGVGFFTTVHVLTPLFIGFSWYMLKKTREQPLLEHDPNETANTTTKEI